MIERQLKKYYQSLDYIEGSDCPEPEEVAAYCDGKLSGSRKNSFETHLINCDSCLELVVASSVGVPEKELVSLFDRAADMVISFVGNLVHVLPTSDDFTLLPGTAMAVAGLRGSQAFEGEKIRFSKTFNDLTAQVDVAMIKPSGGIIKVRLTRDNKPLPEKIRVSLAQNHKEISSYLTEDGEVAFEYFAYGLYVLNFSRLKTNLGEMSIMIEGDV